MNKTLGLFETKGFAAALAAADIILDDEDIELIKIEKTGGGIVSLFFIGESERLKVMFEKGIPKARLVGEIVALHVLPRINSKIETTIPVSRAESKHSIEKEVINQEYLKNLDILPKISGKQFAKTGNTTRKQTEAKNTNKSLKIPETTTTIQRLRQEALASAENTRESKTSLKVRDGKKIQTINLGKIENLNVHEMRRMARSTSGYPIQGREISKASCSRR